MDGVIYHGNRLLPGAAEFVTWLQERKPISGVDTVLVVSGVSDMDTIKTYAYQPTVILEGVGCIVKELRISGIVPYLGLLWGFFLVVVIL